MPLDYSHVKKVMILCFEIFLRKIYKNKYKTELMQKETENIIKKLKSMTNPRNIEGMARFGINTEKAFGIPMPEIRAMGKKIGKNHELALKLWDSGIHEVRILASLVAEPEKFTEKEMDLWVSGFNSWDVCDQCCLNLFDKVPFYGKKIKEYSKSKEEFVKRTAFAIIACAALHKKEHSDDKEFLNYLPIIKKASADERNFVKKAVNWALRQIGKRSIYLNKEAIKTAKDIQNIDSKAARWIANDALRELESEKLKARLIR